MTKQDRNKYAREWRRRKILTDPEFQNKLRKYSRDAYWKDPEKARMNRRIHAKNQWHSSEEYRARRRECQKRSDEKHSGRKLISRRAWRIKNKDKINANMRQWRKKYYANNLSARIAARCSNRIKRALKGNWKRGRAIDLLGCSIDHLRCHLQIQFRDGMHWNNYGTVWHIDHMRPCRSFDLRNEREQKECFNWRNLQPLFSKENLIKSGKYDGLIQTKVY
jgi:hypothetical protein